MIKFALYHNPPQLFSDEKGQAQGMVVDVRQYIASEEGWMNEYVPCDKKGCLEQLKRGQIDLMCPTAFQEEPVFPNLLTWPNCCGF